MEIRDSLDSVYSVLNNADDYITDNIQDIYPLIKEYFSNLITGNDIIKEGLLDSNEKVILRALRFAFGPCLELFPTEELNRELLQYSCPVAKTLFLQTLKRIENETLQSDKDIFATFLCTCQQIISFLINTFKYLDTAASAEVVDVGSLLICSSEILFQSYEHCFKSEEYYGSFFNSLNEILTSFFLRAQTLQGHLLNLMSRIEWSLERCDIHILNDTLTFIYKSGIALLNLDIKTMADLWKGYAGLITKYSELLRNQHDISIPIKFLSLNVINNLEKCFSEESMNPEKLTKAIKVLNFILKVIIKFIENFSGSLAGCYDSLVNLVIFLTKVNESHLSIFKLPGAVNYENLKPLLTGIDPLLKWLIGDREFAKEISKTQPACTTSSKRIEFLLSFCSILKKLTISDLKTREIWFGSDDNIVNWIFQIFHLCMKMPGVLVPGKRKQMTDLFEYVLQIISGFLVMSTSKEFILAEKLLLKYILQTNPWSSLLAVDIWCILARFADAEVCYTQVRYLSKILLKLGNLPRLPHTFFLESLIRRLFPLMNQKHKDSFSVTYSPENYPHLWPTFGVRNLSKDIQKSVNCALYRLADNRIHKFLESHERIKSHYLVMENALIGLSMNCIWSTSDLNDSIAKLWNFETSKLVLNPLHQIYIKTLCTATVPLIQFMTSQNILSVLQQMNILFHDLSPSCKLHCLESLDTLANTVIPVGFFQATIFSMIASLFYEFLSNKNIFVRLRSMKVFQNFAAHTNYSQIIMRSMKNDAVLQSRLTNYLQRKTSVEEKNWEMSEYLEKLEGLTYEHICNEERIGGMKLIESDNYYKPCTKRLKLDHLMVQKSHLENTISILKSETNKIRQCANILSNAQKLELKAVSDALLMVLE